MRRANGTGSIVKLSGNRRRPYIVKISARDKDGYVRQVALSYHAKLQEAQEALEEYNRKAAAGQTPSADMLSWTVEQVYTAWSEREYPRSGKSSVASHKASWNQRVSRYAARKMRSVTLDEWQAILDEGEDEGRSQSSINNDAILIRALHAYAMKRDIIGKDYSRYLDIPTVDIKVKKGALNDLQLAKLEELARAGFPGASEAMVLCYTGLRISEFLSLTPFAYRSEDGGYLQCGVKSAAGRDRIIPIHPKISAYVQQWLSAEKGMSSDRYRIGVYPSGRAARHTRGHPALVPPYLRHPPKPCWSGRDQSEAAPGAFPQGERHRHLHSSHPRRSRQRGKKTGLTKSPRIRR